MPNRIIKESICTSANLNELAWSEECLFYRLLVNCDDYGRFYGRPAIVRARCFPLKLNSVSEKDVVQWLKTLSAHRLIETYEVDGEPYLRVATWDKHQQIRARRSKFPDPLALDSNGNHLLATASNSPRNRVSKSESESESESEARASTRARDAMKQEIVRNVFLTDEEVGKLEAKFGDQWRDRVERLSEYKCASGKAYESDYDEILIWDRTDKERGNGHKKGEGAALIGHQSDDERRDKFARQKFSTVVEQ